MHHLRSRHARILAMTLSASLVAAACGDDASDSAPTETTAEGADQTTTTVADPLVVAGADSAAAALRADLSVLMVENVLLAGDVAAGAATGELPARPEPVSSGESEEEAAEQQPTTAADANAGDLADLLGSVLGVEGGEEVHAALLARLAALDAYARAGGSGADAEAATDALARADEDLADLLTEGVATAGTIAPESALESISSELLEVADEAIDDPDAPVDLGGAPETAATLAVDLAPLLVATRGIEGDPEAVGAVLRSDLATALTEHSYLVTAASSAEPGYSRTLEASSAAVADTLVAAIGESDAAQLAGLIGARAEAFVEYGVAVAASDEARSEELTVELGASRDELGGFFASRSDGTLVAEAVAESLVPNEEAQLAAISAAVAGDDDGLLLAREAALATSDVALTLAVALQLALSA